MFRLWLHQISHGIDLEQVSSRQLPKSIGCSKHFRGKMALDTVKKVDYWLKQLADELEERLEKDKNNVSANLFTANFPID